MSKEHNLADQSIAIDVVEEGVVGEVPLLPTNILIPFSKSTVKQSEKHLKFFIFNFLIDILSPLFDLV